MNGDADMRDPSEGLDFGFLLSVLRRRLPLVVLCAVIVTGAAYAFSKHQTKKYTATASLIFNTSQLSQELVGLPSNSSNLIVQQAGNVESVQLGDMAAATAQQLGHGLTEEAVRRGLSVSGLGESSAVSVAATSTSPQLAAAIANAYVTQFVKEQQTIDRQFYRSALALVRKQLSALPRRERIGPGGVALQNRAQSLQFLSELQSSNVRVAQAASVPSSPSSPKTSRNTALGLFLGLLLGLGIVILLERVERSRRLVEPSDLEDAYGAPLLGCAPQSASLLSSDRSSSGGNKRDNELFDLVGARLRSLNSDIEIRTLLVASAARHEGSTTIAYRLAQAAARLGARVVLIEADLRSPSLAQTLSLGSRASLNEVLRDQSSVWAAIGSQEKPTLGGSAGHATLDLLPASSESDPASGALLNGLAMTNVLAQVQLTYDLVVIDSPPLAVAPDAFPLLGKVDGVVLVGRVKRGRRELADTAREVLSGSGARLLGVVAYGTRSSKLNVLAALRMRRHGHERPDVVDALPASVSSASTPTRAVLRPDTNGASAADSFTSPPAQV
ncbi:MAG TPA: Wzz/FepE/Etk N-terminal domain-containing protein [Solirubrobacteraceae bacterium]|jgi:Mrp family chromosome partitioning ATPase